MKKTLIALAILLSTSLGSMQVARADACMDSPEEAVAAFWTGGASYFICKTIETVQSMVRVVQTLANSMSRMTNETIDTARQLVQETANSVDQNTRNAMNRLNGMVSDARRLATTPPPAPAVPATRVANASAAAALNQQAPGAAALKQHGSQAPGAMPVPEPMADPNQLRDALRQGADTMARIHSTLQSQAANHIYSATQLARNQAERHLNAARRIGETSLMAPIRQLEQMLNDILRHPERLFDPTALVNESIERLTVAMTQVVEQIHHEISSEALATVRGVDQHVRRVTGDTETATRLHEAMTKAHQARTQQSLDKLRAVLRTANGGTGTGSGSAVTLHSSIMFQVSPHIQQVYKASLDKAKQPYQQHINTLKLQGTNIKGMRAMKQANRLPPGTEQRAKAELDRMLKGKSPAEAEIIKRDLKARLLAQYRNVPAVHAELNRNFDSRFTAHLRANPALLRPVAPAAGQPGLLLPAVQK